MNKQTNQPAEKKKNPLSAIIIVLVVLAVLGAAAMIGRRIPDTMELERKMDVAATSINADGVTALAAAIEQHPQAANLADARRLADEMIKVAIDEATAATDYRTLEAFTAALKENTAWKPYATEENQKKLADAWAETLRRMQKDQDQLNELKAVAARIVNAPALVPADIGAVADFRLPVGLAGSEETRIAAVYAAAIALKAQDLADSTLALAADKEKVRAGTEEPCEECGRQGTVPCQSCVRNPGKCPSCNGTGVMKATKLVGKKFESVDQPCTRCDGSGQCAACKGTGKRECFYCKGTTKRVNTQLAVRSMKENLKQLIADIDRQGAELERLKAAAAR